MGDKVELKLTQGPVAAFNVDKIALAAGAGTGLAGTNGTDGADGIFSEIASQAEAEAGTDNTKGMTPLRSTQAAAVRKTILGQYDTRTDLTATNGSTMTCNYSLGNAFKINASAMGAGESFTITMSNLPAGVVYSAWSILIVTGANLPTVSYTALDADVATPVLIASKDNEIIGRTWDNGTKIVYTLGESY